MDSNLRSQYESIKQFADQAGGLLVVGHGTRLQAGQQQLLDLVASMSELCPSVPIEASFLELAEPTIEGAIAKFKERGIRKIFVVPILLFSAAHARDDIPNAVQEASQMLGVEVAGQSDPLNNHWATLSLSMLRSYQAMLCSNPEGCNQAAFCERAKLCIQRSQLEQVDALLPLFHNAFQKDDAILVDESVSNLRVIVSRLQESLSKTALVMIGRGTSEIKARQAMRQFARERCAIGHVAFCEVGFFAGDEMTIDAALDVAGQQALSNEILVQPHLLFEGQLTGQLRESVSMMRIKYPTKRWNCAMPLGGDRSLAETYLTLANDALDRTHS